MEKLVINTWEDVLKTQPVGRNDDFFPLGGDSLVAMRMVNQLRERLSKDVPIHLLLSHNTTVAGFVQAIEKL